MRASTLRADAKLREMANLKEDVDTIAITSCEIVAAEAHYHHSCYKSYTRDYKRHYSLATDQRKTTSAENDYATVEYNSYMELFEYIRETVMPFHDVITLSSITG